MAIPIGLQLYSVRDDCARDLPGTLEAVAKMGYTGVEFAGYHGYGADDLRKMLDGLGLECYGTHTPIDALLGDEFAATVEFSLALGNPYPVVPWLAEERRGSRAAWLESAALFNDIAERLKPHGLRTGYHNHMVEFTPMDGETPWDAFFGNASPDVIMQLDTGNAMRGGGDPVPFVERYPGRATTVHLKEFSATDDKALIGEGDVDWDRLFDLCETVGGTQWYIVEQESYAHEPLKCVELCLEALRAMGK